jgi:hypothetical protein
VRLDELLARGLDGSGGSSIRGASDVLLGLLQAPVEELLVDHGAGWRYDAGWDAVPAGAGGVGTDD